MMPRGKASYVDNVHADPEEKDLRELIRDYVRVTR